MSKNYFVNKLDLLLGGGVDLGENQGGGWSPNNVKFLIIGDDFIQIVPHIGEHPATLSLTSGGTVTSTNADPTEVESLLNKRAFQNLEGVFHSGNAIGSWIESYFRERNWSERYWTGGLLPSEGLSGTLTPLEGKENGEWVNYWGTNSAYPFDEKLEEYFQSLISIEEGEGVLDEDLGEEDEEEDEDEVDLFEDEEDGGKDDALDEVREYLKPTIKGVVDSILREYDKLFASGYEVIKPEGILTQIGGNYRVLSLTKDGELKESRPNNYIKTLGVETLGKMELDIRPERSVIDIANVLVKDGDKKLYFPYKILEYAFGMKHILSSGSEKGYSEHSSAKDWTSYKEQEVTPSLTDLVSNILINSLETKDLMEDGKFESDEAQKTIVDMREVIIRSLTTCVLVSIFDGFGGKDPSKLKVRIVDNYGTLGGNRNVATEAVINATTSVGPNGKSLPIVKDGAFYEFTHELDHQLAHAEPLFALQALKALEAKGVKIDWNNLILGKKDNDEILTVSGQAGTGVSFFNALAHLLVAGSRSGKGVMTLNILAAAIQSLRPIFYLDNKPDIGSIIRYLSPGCFVVNGPDKQVSKVEGFDYYEQFVDEDKWIKKEYSPDYLFPSVFSSPSYSEVGNVVYIRAMLLVLGMILARSKGGPDAERQLGGEKGIVVVFDELEVMQTSFLAWVESMKTKGNIANVSYADEYAEWRKEQDKYEKELESWEAGGEEGKKPTKPKQINALYVPKSAYWFTAFMESIYESVRTLTQQSKIGLANRQANICDIFVLSQNLMNIPVDPEDLFFRRNKGDNKPRSTPRNKNILHYLARAGSVDGFFGYKGSSNNNILAQTTPGSPSEGKLDQYARNFAYVREVGPTNHDKIINGDWGTAESALYFKPFLILIEGNEPFTTKAKEYAQTAGVDWSKVVERNEDPNRPGELDPATGFKGYLDRLYGNSDYIDSMSQSGKIAQNVVEKLGYTGSWMEFLHDLRPEWMFSVWDVVEAFQGVPLKGKYREYLREFSIVYPDEINMTTGMDSGHNDSFSQSGSQGGAQADGGDSGGQDEFSADSWSSFAEVDESVYTTGRDGFGKPVELENRGNDAEGETQWGESRGTPEGTESWGSAPEPVNPFVFHESEGKTDELPFGSADTYQPYGSADWVDTGSVDFNSGYKNMQIDPDAIRSMITQAIFAKIPMESIRELAVVGRALVVNKKPVRLTFGENLLNSLYSMDRSALQAGLLADFFQWGYLDNMSNLQVLKVDSKSLYRNITDEIGIKSWRDMGVSNMFSLCDSLEKIVVAGNVFRREDGSKKAENLVRNSIDVSDLTTRVQIPFTRKLAGWSKGSGAWGIKHFRQGNTARGIIGIAGATIGAGATVGSGILGAGTELLRSLKRVIDEEILK